MNVEKRNKLKFSLYIAQRYLFSKGSTNVINITTIIAAIGILVGAMCLFVVLSGFDGLRQLHAEFTTIADPDFKAFPKKGKFFTITNKQIQQLEANQNITSFSTTIEHQVLLNYKEKRQAAFIKGVDKNYSSVIATDSLLTYGQWKTDNLFNTVIGNQISNNLALGINNFENPLEVYIPKVGNAQVINPINAFRKETLVVSGIYQLTNELDKKYIFANIDFARKLFDRGSHDITNIEFKLAPNVNQKDIAKQIHAIFNHTIDLKSRLQLNDAMYKMLNSENLMVYFVFTLVLIIALFNLIGAMIMMIIDKKKNIKTLFKLGATLTSIKQIFFFQGILMTTIVGLVGILLGVVLILAQQSMGLVMIAYNLPYPTALNVINVFKVLGTLMVLGTLASFISVTSIKKEAM